ncbi:MAG: ECF transporter S component [Lachnospiraceae bacterium]|nr:ECF transporter S component [Lachnospiraceae bacterium]
MNSNTKRSKTLHLTQLALLTAIIFLMAFTPLGYLRIGALSITFLTIPVVIGATALSPRDGAFLGAVFGATSFAQCFGMDPFGTTLCSISLVNTALMCFIPRILIGLVSGYLMRALRAMNRPRMISYILCCLAGALTNTVIFMGMLILLFGHSEYVQSFGSNALQIVWFLTGVNAIVEAIVCTVVGGVVAERINAAVSRMS